VAFAAVGLVADELHAGKRFADGLVGGIEAAVVDDDDLGLVGLACEISLGIVQGGPMRLASL